MEISEKGDDPRMVSAGGLHFEAIECLGDRVGRARGDRGQVDRDAEAPVAGAHDLLAEARDVAAEAEVALAVPGLRDEALGLAREEVAELAGGQLGGAQGEQVRARLRVGERS